MTHNLILLAALIIGCNKVEQVCTQYNTFNYEYTAHNCLNPVDSLLPTAAFKLTCRPVKKIGQRTECIKSEYKVWVEGSAYHLGKPWE